MIVKPLTKKTPPNHSLLEKEVFYPETDGKPMAESDFQAEYLMYLVQTLKLYFANQTNVYISGNLLIYYEKDNPKVCVAPDVFVVFGVANYKRRVYKIWQEGKTPDVIIEITSKTTRKEDEVKKPAIYQKLGIKEYFQYDPTGDYLNPALKGRWLDEDGLYQTMATEKTSSGAIRLESRVLGLYLEIRDGHLRLYDSKTNSYLPSLAEAKEEANKAKEEADKANAELKVLKAHLKTLGIDPNSIIK